jgi:hypothetical protein
MLERLIAYWRSHAGVRFVTFEEAARLFRVRSPYDALAPASTHPA